MTRGEILSLLPKKINGIGLLNARCREIARMLTTLTIPDEDLKFFEQEVKTMAEKWNIEKARRSRYTRQIRYGNWEG